ncbi:hypothetical protein D3C85_1698770 [compost metagenome]
MKPVPTPHTQRVVDFMAERLQIFGWQVGAGDINKVVLYMPPGYDMRSEQDFTDFIGIFKKAHNLKLTETIEFHFYKGDEWRGGIVMVPKFE